MERVLATVRNFRVNRLDALLLVRALCHRQLGFEITMNLSTQAVTRLWVAFLTATQP